MKASVLSQKGCGETATRHGDTGELRVDKGFDRWKVRRK